MNEQLDYLKNIRVMNSMTNFELIYAEFLSKDRFYHKRSKVNGIFRTREPEVQFVS